MQKSLSVCAFGAASSIPYNISAGAGGERRNSAQESDRFGRKRGDFAMEIMKFRFFLLVFSNKKHFFT